MQEYMEGQGGEEQPMGKMSTSYRDELALALTSCNLMKNIVL